MIAGDGNVGELDGIAWIGPGKPPTRVPERLARELMEADQRFGADPSSAKYAMAFRIIRYFLGEAWAIEKVRLQKAPDPFLINDFNESSDSRFVHMDRVVRLADNLFLLFDSRNFGALVERFHERTTKQCCIEAEVAGFFVEDGFAVEIVKEIGVRGQDFDFIARKDLVRFNVEITARDPAPVSISAVRNSLHGKRDQVPNDNPAILYIITPEEWSANGSETELCIREAIKAFFARSRRFNSVVFVLDMMIPIGEGRIVATAYRPYVHPQPRHPVADVSFLMPKHGLGTLADLHDQLRNRPGTIEAELKAGAHSTPTSFERWLHSVR
jgi:hypothetical protein